MIVELLCSWIGTFFYKVVSCYSPNILHASVVLFTANFCNCFIILRNRLAHYGQKVRSKWCFDEDCSYDRNQSSSGW